MLEARVYSDEELLNELQLGKDLNKAILYIYREYCDYVSSFIMKYGGSRQDAEDVFQDTVVAFIDIVKRERYRKEASIKTFLVSIAKNIWLNEIKKRERAGSREQKFEQSRDINELDVSHYLGEREMKQELSKLLYKLSESCRKILMLFYYENLSIRDMLPVLPYENEQVIRNKKYKCLQQLSALVKESPAVAAQIKLN
jgi:RNA polymerase sigma factor (sigma-70 family)